MKYIIFTIFFLFAYLSVSPQTKYSLNVNITLPSLQIRKFDDLDILITFRNNSDSIFLIPKWFQYGYKKGVIEARYHNIIWEVGVLISGKYHEVTVTRMVKQLPNPLPEEEAYDTLNSKRKLVKRFNIGNYYDLRKGIYRIRARYVLGPAEGRPQKFVNSNWMPLYVKKDISF